MRVYAIVSLLVLSFFDINASNNQTNEVFESEIKAADLEKHLKIIASDELGGRNTGYYGQHLAAEYISNQFRSLGLKPIVSTPIGDSYYQQVDLLESQLDEFELKFDNNDLSLIKDFYAYSIYRDSSIKLPTVFVGFGIESEVINEYENLNLNGKIAIILWGEPKSDNGNYVISGDLTPSAWSGAYGWIKKAKVAKKRGAEEVVFVMPDYEYNEKIKTNHDFIFSKKLLLPDARNLNSKKSDYGGIFIKESSFTAYSGISEKDLNKYTKAIASKKSTSLQSNSILSIKTSYQMEPVLTQNVLALLEGSDPSQGTIVVTAHYDHIGLDNDGIFNGADDDGSGTVSVLELAESFSKARDAGLRTKKNILFMTVTGEEKGLLGSRYYTDFDPVIPLSDIVCNINIDMVGRVDDDHAENEDYVYSIGSDRLSSELKQICETVNEQGPQLELNYEFDKLDDPNNFYKRSDHYNFAKNNIPVVFFFNGTHDDYHQQSDTVEKIRFDIMEKRVRLIYRIAMEIANMDGHFTIDKVDSEGKSK